MNGSKEIRKLLLYINDTPKLQSLLYDMDLLPEQCEHGSRDWRNMLLLAERWKNSRDNEERIGNRQSNMEEIMEEQNHTTVWTNHGEPQPLDDKHFGVAYPATAVEADTDATRQAEPIFEEDYSEKPRHALELRYLEELDKLQLELIQARLERGQFRKERDELLAEITKRDKLRATWAGYCRKAESQRDELLTELRKVLEFGSSGNENHIRTAIANASK